MNELAQSAIRIAQISADAYIYGEWIQAITISVAFLTTGAASVLFIYYASKQ